MLGWATAAAGVALTVAGPTRARISPARAGEPQFTADNRLILPQNYREWIFLSSGLGMSYKPGASGPGAFTNVFVAPSAYRAFQATGRWPDRTMFVLEERLAASKGSINQGGHYQGALEGLAASVKDEKRFAEKWAYFSFSSNATTARANPKTACWDCHHAHGAVDNTFVQFYPTLKGVAEKFGTYREEKTAGGPGVN